jgi:hypothetical protein
MNTNVERDAHEFGLHVRQGGWRLGLLVARNVEKGLGQGARQPPRTRDEVKVSATEFARLSGTSADRVLRYLAAWENAADAGHVRYAADLSPDSDYSPDVESLPEWKGFYPPQYADRMRRAAQQGARERPTEIAHALIASPEAAAVVVTMVLSDEAARTAAAESMSPDVQAKLAHALAVAHPAPTTPSIVGAGPEQFEIDRPIFRVARALHDARGLMEAHGVRSLVELDQLRDALNQMADDLAVLIAGVSDAMQEVRR